MKVTLIFRSRTWLGRGHSIQLTIGAVELHHSSEVYADAQHCTPLVWGLIYVHDQMGIQSCGTLWMS